MTSAGDEWMREIERRQGYDAMAHDEGYGPMKDDLTKRLRGHYAMGPHTPNGKPEFGWRQFEAPPIQHEAADRIEALEAENARLREEGQAVVDRWDTPLWKDAEATGRIINRLRAALKGDSHD